jgi:uncharacterized membrane protein
VQAPEADVLQAWGPALAVAAMALASYLCRISGIVLMSRVRLTTRVKRALDALPGSIVIATIVPIGVQSGPAAAAGILTAAGVMALVRYDLAGLGAGLAVVAALRAAGF